jgi:hypothetical protein
MSRSFLKFRMNNIEETLGELHGILKVFEESTNKNSNYAMMVQKDIKIGNTLSRVRARARLNIRSQSQMQSPSPKDKCFHCGNLGIDLESTRST